MIIPDVNLLLYAHFETFPLHDAARRWWTEALNGDEPLGLTPPALFGFIRLATSRRVFNPPLHVDEALRIVDGWLERPNVQLLLAGPRYLSIAFGLLRSLGAAGNLTTDVQIAAFAIEHQADLWSNDSDFARMQGLRWQKLGP